jgi:hypothetical protein
MRKEPNPEAITPPVEWGDCGLYQIQIKGRLDEHWREWFEGMNLTYVQNGETGLECTLLIGLISDQPALHGLLTKIRNLNLTLLSVKRLYGH